MPYLFIHGLGQSPAVWSETLWRMPGLYAADAHCPDLAHLLRGTPADYGALYRAFSAYCASLPQPLHLCGLSLGGILALQYAAEHPARVASLVLIGAQYRMPKRLLGVQSAVFRLMPARVPADGLYKAGSPAAHGFHAGARFQRCTFLYFLPCAHSLRRERPHQPRSRSRTCLAPAGRPPANHRGRRARGQRGCPGAARAGADALLAHDRLRPFKKADADASAFPLFIFLPVRRHTRFHLYGS